MSQLFTNLVVLLTPRSLPFARAADTDRMNCLRRSTVRWEQLPETFIAVLHLASGTINWHAAGILRLGLDAVRIMVLWLLIVASPTALATTVRMQTSLGNIDIQLADAAAPATVANFLAYVNSGAYVNSFIHRSVSAFVIQGGGYRWNSATNGTASVTANAPVVNEFSASRSNARGTIAMAKVGNDPNSATSQWFFNLTDNSANLDHQNGGFTVFGEVIGGGMQVVDAIAALKVVNAGSPFDSLPLVTMPSGSAIGAQNLVLISAINVIDNTTTSTTAVINFSPPTLRVGGVTTAIATASSSLGVSLTSVTPTVCKVTGSTVEGIAAGVCTVAASQAGDAINGTVAQVTGALVVTGVPTVAAGINHTLALKADGSLMAWGKNSAGQLGDGTMTSRSIPVLVPGVTGLVAAACGEAHTVAVKSDGTVMAWGRNYDGQLGDETTTDHASPVAVHGLAGVVAVAAGAAHNLALKSNGTVMAWGSNGSGQLGDGTTTDRANPVLVPGLTGVIAVAAGTDHSLALKSDGTVIAWGGNWTGQLGHGTTTERSSPTAVPSLTGVVAVAAGFLWSAALKSDGTVVVWGNNDFGQLGSGASTSSPREVNGISGVVAVATVGIHAVALRSDGSVVTWGNADFGLSDNASLGLTGLTGVVAVAAGFIHGVSL